tara:strand:- start:1078 stop:2898 length:1821 start_codon:yes stop_codon:yes gene_type:complete
MCGIAGAFFFDKANNKSLTKKIIQKMCNQMYRRGPDHRGYWFDENYNIGLGHNRLAIIDLSEQANQPIISICNRYVIVFNGEIYNYKELKQELIILGETFQTNSDTEILLKLYILNGKKMLLKLRGMFAFAIWDKKQELVFLARDPYGIKPLYWSFVDGGILFASQVKALLSTGIVNKKRNLKGKLGFWLLGSVPETETWFQDIKCLKSGHYCTFSMANKKITISKYIDINNIWLQANHKKQKKNDVQKLINNALKNTVKNHLVSDVPIGVLLSGGIDSATLISHLVDLKQDIQAITISFKEYTNSKIDEVPRAKKISKYYNIKHHIRIVTKEEFLKDLPEILVAMDQPSIDGINTWYACKAAAELKLKVVLSGIGGDELFFGYPSFFQVPVLVNFLNILKIIPGYKFLIKIITYIFIYLTKNRKWDYLYQYGSNLYSAYWLKRGIFNVSEIKRIEKIKNDEKINIKELIKSLVGKLSKNKIMAVGQMESQVYLRNQLLRDSDWASMYHGVELRTPLVDYFLLNELKDIIFYFKKYNGKEMLANSADKKLPDYITKSYKTGFSIPVGKWIKEKKVKNQDQDNCLYNDSNDYKYLAHYISENIYKKY